MAKPITFRFLGDDKQLKKTLSSVERGIGGVGKVAAVGFAAVSAGAVAAAGGLAFLGSSFEDASNTIRVGTGATGEALQALNDDFKAVAKGAPASFGDVSTAIADLNTRLGITGEPLQELSTQFLNLSRITKTDVAGNVDRITRVFGDWGVTTEEQASNMDLLFRTSQATGIGIDELAGSMVQFGAPMRNLGFTMLEAQTLLGLFNKTGVNTETVMSGLRAGIGKVAKSGEDVSETFNRVVAEITELGPGSEATAKAIELFGQRAGPDLADAIAGGKFELTELRNAIATGTETINAASADTLTLGDRWTMVKNNVFIAIQPLATKLFNALEKGMEAVIPKVEELAPKIEEFGNKVIAVAEIAVPKAIDIFRRMIDTGKNLVGFLQSNQSIMIGVAGAIGTAFVLWAGSATAAAVATIAAAAPFIALAAAVGLGVVVVTKLYRENETFRRTIDNVATTVKVKVLPALIRFGKWFRDDAWPVITRLGGYLNRQFNGFLGNVVQSFTNMFNIGKKVVSTIQKIIDKVKNVKDAVSNFSFSDALGSLNPFGRAFGGPVTQGGIYSVGENGPEDVILPRGAQVIPAHQSVASQGNNHSQTINVNVHTNANPFEIGREIAWQVGIS